MTPSFDYYYYQQLPDSLRDSLSCANSGLLWSNMFLYHGQPWLIPAYSRAVWPWLSMVSLSSIWSSWLTMVKPWLYHCQTIVHHGWKPCLPFNHGVTMVAHALSILSPGKIVAQTSQGLFNSKYERKHEMDSGSTSSKMTPSCKWPILSLPIASEIEVGFKACLYFI